MSAGGNKHQRSKWSGGKEAQKTTRAETGSRGQAGGTEGLREEESRFGSGGDDNQVKRRDGGRCGRARAAFVSSRALGGATPVPMSLRPPGARASCSP